MRTAAEAFSGENNILPLDGRGLGKHTSQATLPSAATAISLPPTPTSSPKEENGQVLLCFGGTAQEQHRAHHYGFMGGGGENVCLTDCT